MDTKFRQIFKEMTQQEPSEKLKGSILRRIEMERGRQIRRKLFFSYASIAASFSATVYGLIYIGGALLNSEFWSILSLAFSDAQIVAGYWKTYLYSLLETFPAMSLVLILIPVLGLMMSAGSYLDLRNKNKNFNINHLRTA